MVNVLKLQIKGEDGDKVNMQKKKKKVCRKR